MDNFATQSSSWATGDVSDFESGNASGQSAAAWQDAVNEAQLGRNAAPDGTMSVDGAAGQAGNAQLPIVLAQTGAGAAQPAPAITPLVPGAAPAPTGMAASPNARMTLSEDGLNALYNREAQAGVSNHTHFPGGSSGVTLGPGYDMRWRTPEQVATDLTRIGVDPSVANTLSQGAGLHDTDAQEFATAHHDDVSLTDDQQRALLAQTTPTYEQDVRDTVHTPLNQRQFDATVSYDYNTGAPAFHRSGVARLLNNGGLAAVPDELRRGNRRQGAINRRNAEAAQFEGTP